MRSGRSQTRMAYWRLPRIVAWAMPRIRLISGSRFARA
jgi:hypothetical protein